MSHRTNRVHVAPGERPQPVGEVVIEADDRSQASVFRYAVEWLENPERFAIACSRPLGESPFHVPASRTNPRDALPGPIGDSSPDSWGCGLIRKAWSGELTELDYLLAVDDIAREGVLRYCDDDGMLLARTYPPTPRLNELRERRGLASATGTGRQLTASDRDRLLGSAGSLGDTRPKVSIREENCEVAIAKFTSDGHIMPVERACRNAEPRSCRRHRRCIGTAGSQRHESASRLDQAVRPQSRGTRQLPLCPVVSRGRSRYRRLLHGHC